jgi:hypothetical protein
MPYQDFLHKCVLSSWKSKFKVFFLFTFCKQFWKLQKTKI